jgi:hypothetical protein
MNNPDQAPVTRAGVRHPRSLAGVRLWAEGDDLLEAAAQGVNHVAARSGGVAPPPLSSKPKRVTLPPQRWYRRMRRQARSTDITPLRGGQTA